MVLVKKGQQEQEETMKIGKKGHSRNREKRGV